MTAVARHPQGASVPKALMRPRSPLPRGTALKRTAFRVRSRGATEKRAQGRASETREGWTARKLELLERSGGRCEVTLRRVRCPKAAVDPCHIIPRSQGGSDALDNLFAGCRGHHRQQDAPYFRGKLVVAWDGHPVFDVVTAQNKWVLREASG